MSEPRRSAKEIFLTAADKTDPAERAAFLHEACGDEVGLLRHVEALLRVHDEPDSLLDRDRIVADVALANDATASYDPTPLEQPGTQIGPYKLLQQIGEGGMGTVYMAEQTQPVQRKVALKLIKPGMDSRQIIARFEAERQALAMMDHVNIARVLDAGATVSGRPYFVMELVHGVPITKYCDDHHLTPRERLELFVPVCQAIQHAHQKGIIHRDIKPSNVMVTLYDGKPVPKVIDFGVAKATEQKLTERTLFTHYGTMVGTPQYMSPEQAEMSALGADTRSDIFSLGVLLYELLTGTTPLSRERVREAAYDEVLRMIKEEEPPRPSTRLSEISSRHTPCAAAGDGTRSVPATLASIAAQRKTEPAKLSKLLRGELDWIVMKTLEKDRNRRYETAAGLAADVQRYLADEPVQACPPSTRYRFQKFARKNKAALTTAALVGAALLIGIAASLWQASQAIAARKLADERLVLANERLSREQQARREADEERDRADSERDRAEANFDKALEAVDRMLIRVGNESLRALPLMEQVQREILEDAVEFFKEFLAKRSGDPKLRSQAARLYQMMAECYKSFGRAQEGARGIQIGPRDLAGATFRIPRESGDTASPGGRVSQACLV